MEMENYPFYLKELKLKNFRQFEDLTLPIHPRLTVILSENGGGKTTICDAMDAVMSNDKSEVARLNSIKIGAEKYEIHLQDIKGSNFYQDFSKSVWGSFETYNFSFLYISVNNNKELFNKFKNWFINLKNYEYQTRLEIEEDYRLPELEFINNLWLNFFNALGVARYESISVKTMLETGQYNEKLASYQFLQIKKDGIWFPMEELSAGEKQLLQLFLLVCSEISKIKNYSSKVLTVVIDEIDLHLHPRWQRNLLPALMETFPEVQFIVTTHSPLIVSNVKAEHIVLLKDYKAYPLKTQTAGRDVNSVLLEVFDIPERPKWAAELIDECDKLIAAEQWAEAQKHIDLLSQRFGSTDAEVMRLQLAYDFNAPHNALKG